LLAPREKKVRYPAAAWFTVDTEAITAAILPGPIRVDMPQLVADPPWNA
jgi:hypothetical protein